MKNKKFSIKSKDSKTSARTGTIHTAHGDIQTPAFLPDATQATVKHISPDELNDAGLQIVLGNLYHLWLRPGLETIEEFGGLHSFMDWDKPILTDSGGYQVFSLLHSKNMGKITEEGAIFKSHLDGSTKKLTPEISVETQYKMGSDMILMLDESAPSDSPEKYIHESVNLTLRWAQRSMDQYKKLDPEHERMIFGIVQGGMYKNELIRSAAETASLDFDAFALGGVAVGLEKDVLHEIMNYSIEQLPEEKPRYVLGVGYPQDILFAVELGTDLFDCVIPTRNARHGSLFTKTGVINMKSSRFKHDHSPIDEGCDCYTCKRFSRGYVHHLLRANEPLGGRLATIHNLRFYMRLMEDIRTTIENGTFIEFRDNMLEHYPPRLPK